MRRATHQNEVAHCVREVAAMPLGHVTDQLRDLGPGKGVDGLSLQEDLSIVRVEKAEQRAEQRRLAAAVRAEHAHHLAGREREAHVAADGSAPKPEGERLRLEDHHLLRESANSQRKNGVPISAVSTPGGTSIVAMVRHRVSTASRKAAPSSMASGSRRPKAG